MRIYFEKFEKSAEMRIFRKVTARLYMQTGGVLYSVVFDFGDKLYHTADKPFVFICHRGYL